MQLLVTLLLLLPLRLFPGATNLRGRGDRRSETARLRHRRPGVRQRRRGRAHLPRSTAGARVPRHQRQRRG